MYFRQILLQRALTAGGIAVDAGDRYPREQRHQRLLQLFRAQPYRHQVRGTA